MPSLIDRFTNLIARLRPSNPATTSDEAERTRPRSHRPTDALMQFRLDHDRRSRVNDCRQMYDEDTRTEGVINTLAGDAVKGGFTVTINNATDAKKAQALADDLIKRLDLFTRLDDWTRLSLVDGDTMLEVSVDNAGIIQQVTRKPTLQMHRNSNKLDQFDDPTKAYWLSEDNWFTPNPGDNAIWFADWQIIHARWKHNENSRYGRPLFSSARRSYKFATDGENDIWIRRRTRAGIKYVHKVEGDENAINAYIETNKDTIDNKKAAVQDYYGNVDISVLQGDAKLGEIDDVLHHIETWAIGSPVPMALIGYGKDINRDILKEKKEQYDDSLPSTSEWVTNQFVKPLIELQWLLQGIWPGHIDYEITWASKKTLSPEVLAKVADAGLRLQALGWPEEVVIEILVAFIPGLDTDRLKKAMADKKAKEPDEIDRIAGDAGEEDDSGE